MCMSTFKSTFCLLFCGLFIQPVVAQDFYKWIDKNGTTHYTKNPPPKGAKSVDSVNTYVPKRDAISYGYNNYYKKSNSSSSYKDGYGQSNRQSSNNYQSYSAPKQPERSAEDEALRQKIIQEASTPIKGSRGLTTNQRNTLAAMNGVNVSSGDSYSNSNNSYSAPMPQRPPSTITNCDGAGCWGSDGTRYNRGAGDTYFPSTGGVCQGVGGQMQCN